MSGNARLVVCGIAFVACTGAAVVARRQPALGVNPGAAAPLRAGKFDALEITARGARTTVRRRPDGFWVTAPVSYAADTEAATAAFEAIEKLDPGAIVTTRAQRYQELQVDPAQGIGVRVLQGDRPRLDLVVGKSADGGTMVRVPKTAGGSASASGAGGGDAVWQVNGDLRALLDKVTAEWRDRSVTTFPADDANEIAVETRDGERIQLRAAAEPPPPSGHGVPARHGPRNWTVVASTREIPALDALVADEIVSTLSSLKASDFADGTAPAAAGLDPPALTLTVTLRSGEKDLLLVGGPAGADDFFVKTNEGPQIFRVKAFNIERLARRPIQFRDRLLCRLVDSDIDEIVVRNGADSFTVVRTSPGGRVWRATAPRDLRVDSDKVAPLASVFRGWRAPRIAEDPRPEDLRGRAPVVITGRGPKGSCSVIALAGRPGDETYLAQAPPSPDRFVLPRWMIDRIALKLADLRAR